jgi:methionyl-tRNA formyltransferase
MSSLGAELIVDSLLLFDREKIAPIPQDSKLASYAPMLKKNDGRIEWSRPAQEIYNRMRGFAPWPGAFTTFREHTYQIWGRPETRIFEDGPFEPGEILSSLNGLCVACGDGSCLQLEYVQAEGRKKITAREFANGARLKPRERFVS